MGNSGWVFFPVLAASMAGITYFSYRKERQNCILLRQEGFHVNRLVKKLLLDMQQHRGMANALLNGDNTFSTKLGQKQAEIEHDIAALDALHSRILAAEKRWDDIRNAWQLLRSEVLKLKAEESFRRHSQFVRSIIYLMGDVAERSQFIGMVGACAADTALANALWSKLPTAAEGLAQARGLGMGVAAKGNCPSVAKIRLRFLERRISETMKCVSDDLSRAAPAEAAAMISLWDATHKTVSDFLLLLEEKIIDTEKPSIDANHFFGAATKAIDALFFVFDKASDSLEKQAC